MQIHIYALNQRQICLDIKTLINLLPKQIDCIMIYELVQRYFFHLRLLIGDCFCLIHFLIFCFAFTLDFWLGGQVLPEQFVALIYSFDFEIFTIIFIHDFFDLPPSSTEIFQALICAP